MSDIRPAGIKFNLVGGSFEICVERITGKFEKEGKMSAFLLLSWIGVIFLSLKGAEIVLKRAGLL